MKKEQVNFGSVSEYTEEYKLIVDTAKKLRQLKGEYYTTWKEPAEWAVKYSNLRGKPQKVLTITLTPTGCSWAEAGGCTMCGEYEGSQKTVAVSSEFHIAQFATALAKYIKKYNPSWLRIEQEGNFINESEVGLEAQLTILRLASMINGIERITIEARPIYITTERIKLLKECIGGSNVELEIGMGLEAQNDVIRNICINKGESKKVFEDAVNLMNENGIFPLAYILLKPPFLTEGEAIQEAIDTLHYAYKIGFKRFSLEPMSLHKYTLVDALAEVGCYKIPWLWSVLEVAKSCSDIPELGIGGVGYYPRPRYLAQNHHNEKEGLSDCNKIIWSALKNYSQYRDFTIFKGLSCPCQEKWRQECMRQDKPLKERIQSQLALIDIDKYARRMDNDISAAAENTIMIAGGTQLNYARK